MIVNYDNGFFETENKNIILQINMILNQTEFSFMNKMTFFSNTPMICSIENIYFCISAQILML